MKITTKEMTLSAIFAAVIAVFSVITIPIGVVPVTLGVFGVLFVSVVLGGKASIVSVLVFILVGAVGLPVFSGLKGGAGVILGPTGGYITSYIFMALITGAVSQKLGKRCDALSFALRFAACIVSLLVCYLLGTLQFMLITSKSFNEALSLCVYPFVIFDIIKCTLAVLLGEQLRKRITF
jgi:biotin transport system substrate-specific component